MLCSCALRSSVLAHFVGPATTVGDAVPIAVADWLLESTDSVLMFLQAIDAAHTKQISLASSNAARVDNWCTMVHSFALQSGIARCRVWRFTPGIQSGRRPYE